MIIIKRIKIHNKLLLFFSIAMFLLAIWFIYIELKSNKSECKLILYKIKQVDFLIAIFIIVLLQFINWFIEAIKFKTLLNPFQKIDHKTAICSVYVGNFTSLFTPERIGTFIGRILFLGNKNKLIISATTALGNLAQLITTITFMILALGLYLVLDHQFVEISQNLIILGSVLYMLLLSCLVCVYIMPELVLRQFRNIKFFKNYVNRLLSLEGITIQIKISVLALSFIRYLIFYSQYYVLMLAFDVEIFYGDLFVFLGLLYGLVTFIPSPFIGNLGTREALALYISSISILGVFAPAISFIIWLINVGISSIIGGVIYSTKKINEIE